MAGRLERGEVRLLVFLKPDKQWPVFVLTNSGSIPHLSKVTVAGITSTLRGVASEVVLDVEDGMKHRWWLIFTIWQRWKGRWRAED